MRRHALLALAVLALGPWTASPVHGHARSHSFSDWTFTADGRVSMSFLVAELELRRLGDSTGELGDPHVRLAALLEAELELRIDGRPCEPAAYEPLAAADGFVRVGAPFRCEGADPSSAELEVTAFFDAVPDHLHFAKVRRPAADGGTRLTERILSAERTVQPLGEPGAGAVFVDYLVLGVEHILIGIDHLAFLLALLILCSRARDVVWLITGFTVGHSITLSLAVLGWVRPNMPVIEAFIGFTIALVAAEHGARASRAHRPIAWAGALALGAWALLKLAGLPGLPVVTLVGLAVFTWAYLSLAADERWATACRPALTVCFGLVHGFGFAGVLMDLGLAPGRLAASLFGFNLGVELGQLLVVLLLVAVARPLQHRLREWRAPILDLTAAGLCALGLYWLVQRAWIP